MKTLKTEDNSTEKAKGTKKEKEAKRKKQHARLGKFYVVSIIGWILNILVVFICLTFLDLLVEHDLLFQIGFIRIKKIIIAQIIAIGVITVYNFTLNKYWTFKTKEKGLLFNIKKQFVRYIIVGLSGVIVNLTLTYFFGVVLLWNPYIAVSIGFIVSVFTNFILNDYWTFNSKFGKKKMKNEKGEYE